MPVPLTTFFSHASIIVYLWDAIESLIGIRTQGSAVPDSVFLKSGNGFLSELCQVSRQHNKIGVALDPAGYCGIFTHIGKELSRNLMRVYLVCSVIWSVRSIWFISTGEFVWKLQSRDLKLSAGDFSFRFGIWGFSWLRGNLCEKLRPMVRQKKSGKKTGKSCLFQLFFEFHHRTSTTPDSFIFSSLVIIFAPFKRASQTIRNPLGDVVYYFTNFLRISHTKIGL